MIDTRDAAQLGASLLKWSPTAPLRAPHICRGIWVPKSCGT